MYCVVVWHRVINKMCVLCGSVALCYRYGVCTLWWCCSVLYVWFVYCVVMWQRAIGMVCVLCGGVAACHRNGACNLWWRAACHM